MKTLEDNGSEPSDDFLDVEICNGKYRVIQDYLGRVRALRYDEEWRDCVGDNLVLCLAQEVQSLRDGLAAKTPPQPDATTGQTQ